MKSTTTAAYALGISATPVNPNLAPIKAPTTTWHASICAPPCRNSFRRPSRSTVTMETKVAKTLTRPVITADMSDASSANPSVLNSTGA
uniref:Uncharacterized protein n=1 Tax=Arundo donax TaxID=35708 RepID=A0A0A9D968_ARUDO